MTYILIFISAVFVNNIVLSQFLGICPFLGVSKKIDTALGMSGAVAFVMTIATIITYIIQKTVLEPFNIGFLQTITFILIIAALVQMVEIILKKVSPALYQALGVFLPLITTNCAILGVAIMVIQKDFNLLESVVFAISTVPSKYIQEEWQKKFKPLLESKFHRHDRYQLLLLLDVDLQH
jgi:electron transport complex protein RnfA